MRFFDTKIADFKNKNKQFKHEKEDKDQLFELNLSNT